MGQDYHCTIARLVPTLAPLSLAVPWGAKLRAPSTGGSGGYRDCRAPLRAPSRHRAAVSKKRGHAKKRGQEKGSGLSLYHGVLAGGADDAADGGEVVSGSGLESYYLRVSGIWS